MRLIAEGTDDEDTDAELRLDAVSSYLDLVEKPHLPDILVKIICWVSVCVGGGALNGHLCSESTERGAALVFYIRSINPRVIVESFPVLPVQHCKHVCILVRPT